MTERRYGQWSGNERGRAEDPTRCIEEVPDMSIANGIVFKQCSRKRGFGGPSLHGQMGLWCKQHGKRHTIPKGIKEPVR